MSGSVRRALLLGAYGQSNLGDDLLLLNFLRLLRDQGFGEIVVNTSRPDLIPDVITAEFPGLTLFSTYDIPLPRLIALIRSVDVVVYGGGTVYKELYRTTGRRRYSLILRILGFNAGARVLGRSIYHLHIGIGVLQTRLGRSITRGCLRPARYTLLRDAESYRVAREVLRIPDHKVEVGTDALFLDRTWAGPWRRQTLPLPSGEHRAVVGINVLHDVPDQVDLARYVAAVRAFIVRQTEQGSVVVLLPFQHDVNPHHDLAFMRENFGDLPSCVILDVVPLDLVGDYLRQLDVLVAMRFHAMLLATALGVPYLALPYDPKCFRLLEEIGYPHAVPLGDVSEQALSQGMAELVANRDRAARLLAEAAETGFARAARWRSGLRLH